MEEKNLGTLTDVMNEIQSRFNEFDGSVVRVGWFGNTLSGKMRLAEIARILNYGHESGRGSNGKRYPALPERNFMRLYEQKWLPFTYKKINNELKKVILGTSNLETTMKAAGTQGVTGLTKAMNDPFWKSNVPNSPVTIEMWAKRHFGQIKKNYRKKGMKMPTNLGTLEKQPLRDTGHLIQSIHWDVKKTI